MKKKYSTPQSETIILNSREMLLNASNVNDQFGNGIQLSREDEFFFDEYVF